MGERVDRVADRADGTIAEDHVEAAGVGAAELVSKIIAESILSRRGGVSPSAPINPPAGVEKLRQEARDEILQVLTPQQREALSHLGEAARPAAVLLVRANADESDEVREWVVAALEELGPPDIADTEQLAGFALDDNRDVAYWAITLLGRLGASALPALGQVTRAMSSHAAAAVRQRAAWALGKIGPAASSALDALRTASSGDDPRLARLAARAIGQIDQGASEA